MENYSHFLSELSFGGLEVEVDSVFRLIRSTCYPDTDNCEKFRLAIIQALVDFKS